MLLVAFGWMLAVIIAPYTLDFILLLLSAVTSINISDPVPLAAIQADDATPPQLCLKHDVPVPMSCSHLSPNFSLPIFLTQVVFICPKKLILEPGSFSEVFWQSDLAFLFLNITSSLCLGVHESFSWLGTLTMTRLPSQQHSWLVSMLWSSFFSPTRKGFFHNPP